MIVYFIMFQIWMNARPSPVFMAVLVLIQLVHSIVSVPQVEQDWIAEMVS